MAISLSIEDALQTISRSEASGVLTIAGSVDAVFVRGSLSHISDANSEEVAGICGLLRDAGCLADSVVALVEQANMAVSQLGTLLVSKEYLSQEEFRRARLAFQKNKMLELLEDTQARAEFTPDRTARSHEDSLNILAAELLLDVVGMRAAQREIIEKLEAVENARLQLAQEYEVKGLTIEEVVLITILQRSNNSASLLDLESASLLSKSEFYIALKALVDKQFVTVDAEEELQVELDSEEEEGILSDLFDDELEASDSESEDGEAEFDAGYWGEDEPLVDATTGDRGASVSQDDVSHFDMPPPPELEPGSNRWADNEAELGTGGFVLGLGVRLRMLNYRLTETSAVVHVVTVITILYLVVLAWIMPSMLRSCFEAVGEFTQVTGGVNTTTVP